MNQEEIKKDYSYCSGVACKIRKSCNRYLPNPPDIPIDWIDHSYKEETNTCRYYIRNKIEQEQNEIRAL